MTLRRLLASASLAFLLAASPVTPARADEAAAREHFRRGVEHYDKRRYADALPEFRAAYTEKPSAGIKQNIGLCLKAMGRRVEAATTFDEALDEGRTTLKPETRAAIEQELAELSKGLATVAVKIVAGDRVITDGAALSVDGVRLAPGAERRPIRLEPGIHTFDAHVDGLGDPPQKKLALVAGAPVDATFELHVGGAITIRPSVADASVTVDGRQVARGTWSGSLAPGTHHVEVAAEGFLASAEDVQIADGANLDLPIAMRRPGEAPSEYEAPNRRPPPKRKTAYVGAMLAVDGEVAQVAVPQAATQKQVMAGLTIGLRGGYKPSKLFAIELHLDAGGLEDKTPGADTKVTHWQLTPVARFNSDGRVRFVLGTGVGVHGIAAETTLGPGGTRKGSAVTASWLLDAGVQFDAGPIYVEPALFFDLHGIGTVRDDAAHERIFEDSPGVRYGLRIALGVPF